MPKLRRLSGWETIRALEALGFSQARQRGSHVVLKKQTPQGQVDCMAPCIANSRLAHCEAF